jgi:nucleotide-binding universal stress UspA family protein
MNYAPAVEYRQKRLLVPLDGSAIAEAAFEEATALARMSDAEVWLLRVVPPIEDVIEAEGERVYDDNRWAARTRRSQDYLARLARRPECEGIEVRTAVQVGRPAETILSFALANAIDMIVLTSHGRSADHRWPCGSVAEKVLRGADVTVLLVRRPRGARTKEPESFMSAASTARPRAPRAHAAARARSGGAS